MYHIPLTWHGQENLRHNAHFEAFPQNFLVFASTLVGKWITKMLLVSLAGRHTRSQTVKSVLLAFA
jgi:hypothetical protein